MINKLPKTVKEGVLNIGNIQIKAFVLDNQQRVIDEQSMENIIEWLKNPTEKESEEFVKVLGEFIHQGKMEEINAK